MIKKYNQFYNNLKVHLTIRFSPKNIKSKIQSNVFSIGSFYLSVTHTLYSPE